MRVLIDALSARLGGGLSYLVNQMEAVRRVRPDVASLVLAAPWNAEALAARLGPKVVRQVAVRGTADRLAFEQLRMVKLSQREGAEVIYCPGNFVPLRSALPRVLTLQNLNYFATARQLPQNRGLRPQLERLLCRASINRSEAVVAIGGAFLGELRADGIRRADIQLIPNGRPEWASPSEPVLDPRLNGRPFFLSLSNDYPHKRLDDLVPAWRRAFPRSPRPSLVLVGNVAPTRFSLRPDLVLLGPVASRGQIRWLLERALALVSASELEAAPLTPAEAGSVGCPLILSDISTHREVAGGHARFFTLGDVEHLATLLFAEFDEPQDRRSWEWPHSWDENARLLCDVFDRVLIT